MGSAGSSIVLCAEFVFPDVCGTRSFEFCPGISLLSWPAWRAHCLCGGFLRSPCRRIFVVSQGVAAADPFRFGTLGGAVLTANYAAVSVSWRDS